MSTRSTQELKKVIEEILDKGVTKAGMVRAAGITAHYLDLMLKGTEMTSATQLEARQKMEEYINRFSIQRCDERTIHEQMMNLLVLEAKEFDEYYEKIERRRKEIEEENEN